MPPQHYKFKVPEIAGVLSAEANEVRQRKLDLFEKLKDSGRFYARVYAPRINPVNGKIVGPETSQVIAILHVTTWHDTWVDAEVSAEGVTYRDTPPSQGQSLFAGPLYGDDGSGHVFEFPQDSGTMIEPTEK